MTVVSDASFALESLAWADGALTVEGRWTGVRGMRFVRPTLTDPDGTRLLADLEDKPWAAEDGEEWRAVFPCPDEPPAGTVFELAVGGGVASTLIVPGDDGRFPREEPAARDELATRLDLMRSERDAALARLDTAREERHDLSVARERAEADLRRVTRERDAALEERDKFKAERDAVKKERTQARRALKAAEKKRDAVTEQRDRLEVERDDARVERDALKADRDSALKARDDAFAARDDALGEARVLADELDGERARVPAPAEPPPQPQRPFAAEWRRPQADTPRHRQRLIAALALSLVFVLAVLLLLL